MARRWLLLFPVSRDVNGNPDEPTQSQIATIVKDKKRLVQLRKRLSSLSWFMKCLNERVARLANAEDGCTGSFWEGRFKAQSLLDPQALVSCMVYVDLNPIRAKVAKTAEDSDFTSVQDRILARQAKLVDELSKQPISRRINHWLYSFEPRPEQALPLSLDEYLELVDLTGREIRKGKRGAIPVDLEPILVRLNVRPEKWLDTTQQFEARFARVAGKLELMVEAAKRAGRSWFKGKRASTLAFDSRLACVSW